MFYSPRQYARALCDLTADRKDEKMVGTVKSFALFLEKNNALHLFREIEAAFRERVLEKEGLREATVRAASEATAKKIKSKLENAETKIIIDQSLRGGASVTVGDIRVDNSVKSRLLEIRKVLTH